jgi:hypothetical protein
MPGIPWTLQNGINTAALPTARSVSGVTFHDTDFEVRARAFRIHRSVLGVRGCVNERSGDIERVDVDKLGWASAGFRFKLGVVALAWSGLRGLGTR